MVSTMPHMLAKSMAVPSTEDGNALPSGCFNVGGRIVECSLLPVVPRATPSAPNEKPSNFIQVRKVPVTIPPHPVHGADVRLIQKGHGPWNLTDGMLIGLEVLRANGLPSLME